jgi:lipopolysaccharide/colanic/teichoic acid biosynthesis glycosyltransferase
MNRNDVAKRCLDVLLAAILLVVLAPLMLVTAMLVFFDVGRPVLFRQTRPGLHGEPFVLVKFRTMRDTRDAQGNPLPTDQRVTRLGRFLRSISIDELPELWNVLRGDMSLVGPRPLLMEYLPLYSGEQFRRHEVRPGITGWAQVNGRNTASWEDRFAMDVWYVDNRSLLLDLKILALTLHKVVRREGVTVPGRTTIDRFMGTQKR